MKTIQVDNLARAAWLISNGVEPVRIERMSDSQSRWIFEWSEQLDRLSTDFYESRGAASAVKRFMSARARLLAEAGRGR